MADDSGLDFRTVRKVLGKLGVRASRLRRVGDRRNIHWVVHGPEGRLVLCRYASDRPPEDVQTRCGTRARNSFTSIAPTSSTSGWADG